MATNLEYAQLAGRVYQRTQANRTPIPAGWTELSWNPGSAVSGFSAGVYRKGDEIVISYTGTNEKQAADMFFANFPVGLSLPSAQVTEAMLLYVQTKQQYPTAQISFTGHSLGAGLASMMSVFFDRQAVVFDAAPFELGARNLLTLGIYQQELARRGFSDATFNSYVSSINFSEFDRRQSNVVGHSIQGEILEALRFANTVILGSETVHGVGSQTILGTSDSAALVRARVDLHSMTLLASMLLSSTFANAIRSLPSALEVFFDEKLYARDPQRSVTPNLLDRLLRQHLGEPTLGVAGNQMLDRFGNDLQRIAASGATGSPGVSKGLIAAVSEYYYFASGSSLTDALVSVGNGVQLDIARFAQSPEPSDGQGVRLLRNALLAQMQGDALTAGLAVLNKATRFTIQSGVSGLNVTLAGGSDDAVLGSVGIDIIDAGSGDDVLIGRAGVDSLKGGSGADVLDGGADNDTLTGGAGNDQLVGGTGSDTYTFEAGFGHDTIIDTDHSGVIRYGSGSTFSALPTGQKVNDTTWKSSDGQWTYVFAPAAGTTTTTPRGSLYILRTGSADSITVQDWARGELGIVLNDTVAAPPTPSRTIVGDLTPTAAIEYDALGNRLVTGVAAPDRNDTLYDGAGNDLIIAGGGHDNVYGPDGGNDHFKLGAGHDAGLGGAGNDLIEGEAGRDILTGGAGNDILKGGADEDRINGGTGADVIDGGDGADLIGGNDGDDVIDGGAGNDFIFGGFRAWGVNLTPGTGETVIAQGNGWNVIGKADGDLTIPAGAWIPQDSYGMRDGPSSASASELTAEQMRAIALAAYTNPTTLSGAPPAIQYHLAQQDNDTLSGGAGDDLILGGIGADLIDGGIGNDNLFGTQGADTLRGGANDDLLYGDGLNDSTDLTYTADADHGDDDLDGGDGADQLYGQGGSDTLRGGIGNDQLQGDLGLINGSAAIAAANDNFYLITECA